MAVGAAAVALALFQPWKLWVDDTVDQPPPAGATAISGTATTPAPMPDHDMATSTTEPAVTAVPPTTVPAPAVPAGGAFTGLDHGTTGTVVLLEDRAGARYVRLEDLDTSNGPDLFVYLSTNAPDGPEGQFDDDIVDLGRLQGNVGSSNDEVPAGTDLTRYASVVIWCNRFDSAFGAAPLG